MIDKDNIHLIEMLKAIRNFCDSILNKNEKVNKNDEIKDNSLDSLLSEVYFEHYLDDCFSVRLVNLLKSVEIFTVRDLVKASTKGIPLIDGVGKTFRKQILAAFDFHKWKL